MIVLGDLTEQIRVLLGYFGTEPTVFLDRLHKDSQILLLNLSPLIVEDDIEK